ncbi:MAG: glycosyltransferase [Edaphocola sp.]
MIFGLLGAVFMLPYIVLLLAYKRGWEAASAPLANGRPHCNSLTIVVPARNEAKGIADCLLSLISNNYPAALREIILIDDFSEDETAETAARILANNNGRVLRLAHYLSPSERLNSYKKKALEIAIGEAKGDWIVTTDADCLLPENWLATMNAQINDQVQFMAAPVDFTPANARRNLVYYFQSLDFMTMQGITAASAALDMGNMCNGANLAFRKTAYEAVNGYKGIDHIASGDDMLLMYKIKKQFPAGIRYLKSEEAIVRTPAQPDWASFLNQRIRWSSKADKYDDKKLIWVLGLVYLFNFYLLALFFVAMCRPGLWKFWVGMVFAKTTAELAFLYPVARFYGKIKELWVFPLLQPLHILYIVLAGFLGKFGTYKWKGRKVK